MSYRLIIRGKLGYISMLVYITAKKLIVMQSSSGQTDMEKRNGSLHNSRPACTASSITGERKLTGEITTVSYIER